MIGDVLGANGDTEKRAHRAGQVKVDLANPWVRERLERVSISSSTQHALKLLTLAGMAIVVAGIIVAPERTWPNVLLASQFLIGIGLGGVFLVAMHYLSGAGWSVAIRRIPEALTALLPAGLAGVAAIVLLRPSLYPWYAEGQGAVTGFKGLWLDYAFLLIRSVLYAALWWWFARALIRNSRAQDRDGEAGHQRRNVALSAGFTVCFALTYWLASVDWVMALEHHWYSTIFGVYAFTGLFASALACTILVAHWLRKTPLMAAIIREDHLHDLGKLLLGATTLWVYIWFSQYMLIWYANIPEETIYYVHRQSGLWGPLFLLNPVLNWVVPFFLLLPRAFKRDGTVLTRIALVVLAGRVLDLYVMIFPAVFPESPVFGIWEVGTIVAMAGLAGMLVVRALRKAPVIPLRDPYLHESLHHHQ